MFKYKIAYLIDPSVVVTGKSNGIRSQALAWANGLRKLGLSVDLINCWENVVWKKYNIIHLFGSGGIWYYQIAKEIRKYNLNIIFSPICDDIENKSIKKLKTFIGSEKLQIWSLPFMRRISYQYFKGVFVRSMYEADYLIKAYGVRSDLIRIVPLSYSNGLPTVVSDNKKDEFCLHISSIYQARKNVIRLIKAAKKYNFHLVLAGARGTDEQYEPIRRAIGKAKNIEVLGFISEDQMIGLYKQAKVFALPSIMEGVGIVALDAAFMGCEIVITNIGAPKEYYNNMGHLVSPYSVDSIGRAVIKALNSSSNQPCLKNYVKSSYNETIIIQKLLGYYKEIIEK